MSDAFIRALELIISGNAELLNILGTTARMSLASSLIALIIGVPVGIWLGSCRFKGRTLLTVINRTLMGLPPVVCGLVFYMLFSGVGPFRKFRLMFTVELMVLAQVALITPIVVGAMESAIAQVAPAVRETAIGLRLSGRRRILLLANETVYQIFSAYLLAFARSIAEVGAVSMVGGAIAWKTNVMTTAIMQYTNRGDFSLGIALGMILMAIALIINILMYFLQRRASR
ncbi:MAG: ABC transporter permease [Lachnospiraceae bacterium]|jgi:tungstate transport system permease protein